MLRTVRAAAAVMLVGGIELTVPPQTGDVLEFLDDGPGWPAVSFAIALIVLAGSASFWSRAALAARFGIDDGRRHGAETPDFNWAAFTWLPRLMLAGGFIVGVVMALRSGSSWTAIAVAVGLGVFAIILSMVRPWRSRRRAATSFLHGSARELGQDWVRFCVARRSGQFRPGF
jgi:hypothetical protein